ncbi:MAG TPA: SRPBCC domain-containing protein [Alphaproteobacteria bacterium]|nr:SRPBCC domain-containing protein [Alphaproteobacteria bacterium]
MSLDIRLERRIAHPIDKVWRVLVSPDRMADWLMANDFAPHVGHRFRLTGEPMPGWRGWADCEVLELDPPTRMVWAWWANDETHETRVTFELTREAAATRLVLIHRGDETPIIAELLAGGWPGKLPALEALLDRID